MDCLAASYPCAKTVSLTSGTKFLTVDNLSTRQNAQIPRSSSITNMNGIILNEKINSFVICSQFPRNKLKSSKVSRISHLSSEFLGVRNIKIDQPALKEQFRLFKITATENGGSDQSLSLSEVNGLPNLDQTPDQDIIQSLRSALAEAETKAVNTAKELETTAQALASAETKVVAYEHHVVSCTEEAMAEVQAAKDTFKAELQKLIDSKANVEAELQASKQHSIELALKVEKMAGMAAQQASLMIAEETKMKMAEAKTQTVEANVKSAEKFRKETDKAAEAVILEAKTAINDALAAAELAREQAKTSGAALQDRSDLLNQLIEVQGDLNNTQEEIKKLEIKVMQHEATISKLRLELKSALAKAESAQSQIEFSEKALAEIESAVARASEERHASAQEALKNLKAAASNREDASTLALKAEIESLKSALLISEKAEKLKEQSMQRRFQALERSLFAAETSAKAWQERASIAEDLLRDAKTNGLVISEQYIDPEELLSRGRMDAMLGEQKNKLKLLAEGPRRERPDWLKRKSVSGVRLPPLKVSPITAEVQSSIPLELPAPEEVWSVSDYKELKVEVLPKVESTVVIPKVIPEVEEVEEEEEEEKKEIEMQRKQLEKTLQRKTVKRVKTPDELEDKMEPGTGSGREIVLQGFNWESHRRKWYLELAPKAADLAASGITTIWLPPPTQSVAPQGYMPTDYYNLNSAYGSMEELKFCIDEMHKCDLLVLGDVVLNHRCAAKQNKDGIWNIFGGKLAWGPEAIVRDDPNFHGKGNPSSGDIFHAAPNVDHSQEFVRRDIKEWLRWLREEVGYDGWRLDFVRGFWGGFVKEYIDDSNPAFCIGEYWDSLGYEGGAICYNQDPHRQRIINWINATGGTSSAFDVTTKGILHSALHNEYWRLIDPQGKPPGVMGWWPSRAVTFLENHDTGSTQGHWPFPRDKVMQGYAYILTHPGTPVVFYDHFYEFGLHDAIAELIAARNQAGIHCRSTLKIFHANAQGYVAQVGDNLVVKLGHFDWNPSKQNNLVGQWDRCVDHGNDYQIWERKG